DFGLAKRHRREAAEVEPVDDVVDALPADRPTPAARKAGAPGTEKGAILGTPSYMAPEQARGEQGRVGPAADVHALGAMFYEMVTGRPPFQAATTLETLMQVADQAPRPVRQLNPHVPAVLDEFCRRCLEKDSRDRYPDAGALADDLEERWRRATQRRRFARLALGAGFAVLLLQGVRLLVPGRGLLDGDWLTKLTAAGGP